MFFKRALLTALITLPVQAFAISLPDGPSVIYDSGFEGTWKGYIAPGCGGAEEDTPARRLEVTLRLCRAENDTEIRGQMKTKLNYRLLQNDATYKPVGKSLKIIDSMSLTNDSPAREVMTELRGKKNRTTNLVLEISDGIDEDGTEAGNLVGTLGNCGMGVIFERTAETSSCSFPKRKKRRSKRKK